MKKTLITDIAGQNGSCLAEFLLSKRYEVHGIIRRASNINTNRIDYVYKDPQLADQIIPITKNNVKKVTIIHNHW